MFIYLILEIMSAVVRVIALIILLIYVAKISAIHNMIKRKGIYIPVILFIVAFFTG